jgi:formylglycine-generating enzyme required for sulfatase activity
MSIRITGDKAVFGLLLAALLAGAPCASAEPDSRPGKGGKAVNYEEMVLVPAGKFVFGKAGKEASLPAFMIDKYEVTNKQYAKFNLDHKYEPIVANFPVVMVSLEDAKSHCEALDKRLPSEEEWEKAARGTDGRLYPWGNDFDASNAVTNETDFEGHTPQPLTGGSHPKGKSPYGAMDMSGNVWEWTTSFEERYSILKGGSFFDDREMATATSRLRSIPDDSKDYVGFRCVKSAK